MRLNELVRDGAVKAPIVIGRDHLDTGSVASPNRETEGMRDGSDAIADWPILNALLNASAGATWVSVHHGGGVGIGYSIHAGMVIVADGTREADERLARVLTCDPGHGRGAARRRRVSRSAAAPHANTAYGFRCRRRADDGSPRRARAPRAGRARGDAGAHSGRARRLRHRPHHAAARAGRSPGPRPVPVHRRRARREHARALPHAVAAASPFRARPSAARAVRASAREAFDRTLALLRRARAPATRPATFLLDEVLELRTFESFPGLRHVLRELLQALAESGNRFVLTTRYVARAHRLLRDATRASK